MKTLLKIATILLMFVTFSSCDELLGDVKNKCDDTELKNSMGGDLRINVTYRVEAMVLQDGQPLEGVVIEHSHVKYYCDGGEGSPVTYKITTDANGYAKPVSTFHTHYANSKDFTILTATCLGKTITKTYNYNKYQNWDGTTQLEGLVFNF